MYRFYNDVCGFLILDSEWNDECIDFTMMCVFLFFFNFLFFNIS